MRGSRTGFRSNGVDSPAGGDRSGKGGVSAVFGGCGDVFGLWGTEASSPRLDPLGC